MKCLALRNYVKYKTNKEQVAYVKHNLYKQLNIVERKG